MNADLSRISGLIHYVPSHYITRTYLAHVLWQLPCWQ